MAFTTSKSLLAKVRNGDEISWKEFYASYKPLILLCGSDLHLNPTEKEELIQNVMCEIFQKDIVGKYDPEKIPEGVVFVHDPSKGRFRNYMRKIIQYQAYNILRKRKENVSLDDPENGIAETLSSQDSWEEIWEEEWQKHIMNEALIELKSRVQSETYSAFEMYAIQNRSIDEVKEFLNMSASAIYTAKSRCISTLKTIIKELDEH